MKPFWVDSHCIKQSKNYDITKSRLLQEIDSFRSTIVRVHRSRSTVFGEENLETYHKAVFTEFAQFFVYITCNFSACHGLMEVLGTMLS